jgi:hypothetical protein
LRDSVGREVDVGVYFDRQIGLRRRQGGFDKHKNGVLATDFNVAELASAETVDIETKILGAIA